MKFNFLPKRAEGTPEKKRPINPLFKNGLERLKEGNFSKREQAVFAALLLSLTGACGYAAFLKAPLEQQQALKAALNASSVAHAEKPDASVYAPEKEILREDEVEAAVANYISADPNAVIVSEEVVKTDDSNGSLNLVVEHNGSGDVLAQYIETLESAPKKIQIDSISYQKDPSGAESTVLRVFLPYTVTDNSLENKTFSEEPSAPTPPTPTPNTTATPTNPSTSMPSTSSSNPKPASGSTATAKPFDASKTPKTRVITGRKPSVSYTPPRASTPSAKPAEKKPQAPTKPKVKPQTDKPPMTAETEYIAPPITRYSALKSILSANFVDGNAVSMAQEPSGHKESEDVLKLQYKIQALDASKDETTEEKEGADVPVTETEATERELRMDTGGFYLPKNGYEFSIDVSMPLESDGKFSLVLADLKGNSKEVVPVRTDDMGDGYHRIFFPLNGMDGTMRATQIRYRFTPHTAKEETMAVKNVQILSNES